MYLNELNVNCAFVFPLGQPYVQSSISDNISLCNGIGILHLSAPKQNASLKIMSIYREWPLLFIVIIKSIIQTKDHPKGIKISTLRVKTTFNYIKWLNNLRDYHFGNKKKGLMSPLKHYHGVLPYGNSRSPSWWSHS